MTLLGQVLGNDDARGLLLHLSGAGRPVRYSAARNALALHPQRFHNALERLEHFGLVGRRFAPKAATSARRGGPRPVELEVTALGHFVVDLWQDLQDHVPGIARRHHIPAASVEGLLA